MTNSVLHVADVHKSFGGLRALSDVDLNVEEGTIHAIIGPNGAGKSTLLNVCVGRIKPDSGHVVFNGEVLDNHTPDEINQLGVSRVFQTPEIFPDLTLLDNVMIPAFASRDGSFKLRRFVKKPKRPSPRWGSASWPSVRPHRFRAATKGAWSLPCA